MQFFRNYELANLYHVSQPTVFKWVEAARSGKLGLKLYSDDGKDYIANTASNLAVIENLIEDRKKYRNTRAAKLVVPSPRFYELYNHEQIEDIISNLTTYREIPLQYSYFDGGADHWDEYANRLLSEDTPNTLKSTVQLLDSSLDGIDRLISGRKRVNVIDLGVGNGQPVKGLLKHLLERGALHRYIGIDISADMLEIARRNIKTWFEDRVSFEGYTRDISYDRFKDLLVHDYLGNTADAPINLVLLFGGTLSNFRRPEDVLRVINNSMAPNDLFLYSQKLDTPHSRRYFDFHVGAKSQPLDSQLKFMLDLLNIDESFYEVEQLFDEERRARFIRVRLKVAVSIKFAFENGERHVELGKDDAVLLWRARHMSALDVINQFARNGFELLQASQTKDHEYLLTVSDIRLE